MKAKNVYTAFFILLLIIPCSACRNKGGADPVSLEELSFSDYRIYEPGCTAEVVREIRDLRDRPVYHIDMIIDDSFEKVVGKAAVRFVNRKDRDISSVDFLLFANNTDGKIDIDFVKTESSILEYEYLGGGGIMRVYLPDSLPPGEESILHISYTLILPEKKTIGYGSLYAEENTISLGYAYPMLPSIGHEPAEIPALYGDHVYSDASFYCVQISAPKKAQIFAAGYPVAERQEEDRQIVLYAAGPARDFYAGCRINGEYVSRSAGRIMLRSCASRENRESSLKVLGYAEKSLALFSRYFGEYPYQNLTCTALPLAAYGLEFPGIIINAESMYNTGGYIRGIPTEVLLESTTVHEIAHQWFYNLSGNDQRIEPWIDEGLAQYSTWLYYREYYGSSAAEDFKSSLYSRWDRIGRKKISIELPVAAYTGEEYGAAIYGLAPIIFIEFAQHVGEECFFDALRSYVSQTRWENGTGELLKQVFEKQCGEDLTEFIAQWENE